MPISNHMAQARLNYFVAPATKDAPEPSKSSQSSANKADFFGPDGLTFGDVLDAINPLNHIPIVSDLFASATGSAPSAASKLAGGTLLGGPIGFVASLAKVIFESATGDSPAQALYAAISGDVSATASSAASEAPADEQTIALASIAPAALPAQGTSAAAVLELYGASADSIHESYRKAQLRPYLQDVTVSKVL